MENELKEIEEIEEKEIITEEDIDESDTENKKYDESRIYYVYEHIRLDKMEPFYIGKGQGERAYDLYRNDHHDAITDKYGHAVVIIADNLTEEEAYWLERDTIEDYVFNLGNGIDIEGHKDYDHALPHLTNMNWGGKGGTSGIKLSEETKEKISEKLKGEKNPMFGKNAYANKTEEEMETIGRNISEKLKGKMVGENNPMYGKHCSEEAKRKISEKMKGKMVGEKNPMFGKNSFENKTKEEMKTIGKKISEKVSKKVICITTGKIFNSIKDAEKYYSCSHISLCCKEKSKSAGKLNGAKLQWRYLEDYNNEFNGILINPNN